MARSVDEVLRSLGVTGESAKTAKRETREWLERVYHEDKTIAELDAHQIRKQATRFFRTHGRALFAASDPDGHFTAMPRKELISKIMEVMTIQVRNKSRTVRGRRAKATGNVDIDSDCDSCATESSPESNALQLQDLQSYAPSNSMLENPSPKMHNTRLNAQPGMPPYQSIEVDVTDREPSESSRRRKRRKNKRRTESVGTAMYDEHKRPIPKTGACAMMTPPGSTPSQRDEDCLPDITQNRQLGSPLTNFQTSPVNIARAPTNDPLSNRSFTTNIQQQASLDPWSFNFTPFLNTPKTHAATCRVSSPATPRTRLTGRDGGSQQVYHQHTPRISISSMANHGNPQHRFPPNTRQELDVDRLNTKRIDFTDKDGHTFFLGNDFKSVRKDRALKVLGSVVNVLNESLTQHQSKANNVLLSVDERKLAAQEARCLCKLLGKLTKDERVWN